MKLVALLLAFVGLAAAQDLGALPAYARECLTGFTVGDNIGSCPRLDAQCICESGSFIGGISCYLSSACSQTDQQRTIEYVTNFCKAQGVQVPSTVTCAGAPGTSTATASATPNAGALGSSSEAGTSIYGGLLAALALF